MPHLRFKLAHGYLANENWMEALRHILPVCLVSDPVIFRNRSHPLPVGRWYLLIYILSEVMEQEKRGGTEAATCLAGLSLLMIYKHYLLRLSEVVSKSHGDHSKLAKAIRNRYAEETDLMNETARTFGVHQRMSLASYMKGPLQDMTREAQRKLSSWAGIPDSVYID
jgi:hypothetical protein